MRMRTLVAIGAVGALVLGACGGDDSDGDAGTTTVAVTAPEAQDETPSTEPEAQDETPSTEPAAQDETPSTEPAAPVETVKIGLLGPLSGPWAEHGELMRMGAELAIDEINEAGGIESLGGAMLELLVEDAGGDVEQATSAAQRLFSNDDLVAAMCCWLSSFTLAATEISEREELPVLTFSFAGDITNRGYEWIFREGAPAPWHVRDAVPLLQEAYAESGRELLTAAMVGDNTAASTSYFDALRDQLPAFGIEVIIDEVWTPPLPDATSLARTIVQAQPDIIFNGATTFADVETLQRALVGAGAKIPILGNGGQFASPAFYNSVGDEGVEYVLSLVGSGVLKGMEDIAAKFEERNGLFMIQDSTAVYAETYIIKEALEAAGSTDRNDVREALLGLDLDGGPVGSLIPGGGLLYDISGQNTRASVAIIGWQDGRPVVVAPAAQAVGQINLPG